MVIDLLKKIKRVMTRPTLRMPWTLSNSLGLFNIYILFQNDFMTYQIRCVNFASFLNIRYWPHATSYLQVNTCKYAPKMGEPSHDTASKYAHQGLCATEFHVCICT